MTAEEWRPVEGWPNYEISSHGRIRSWGYGRLKPIKQRVYKSGYFFVVLYRATGTTPGEHKTVTIHRLVGEAFLGPRPEHLETRHLNGDKTDNRISNLAYGTRSENMRDQILHGTNAALRKTHCPQEHPYDEVNTFIHKDGRRDCRTCRREASRRSYWRRKLAVAS